MTRLKDIKAKYDHLSGEQIMKLLKQLKEVYGTLAAEQRDDSLRDFFATIEDAARSELEAVEAANRVAVDYLHCVVYVTPLAVWYYDSPFDLLRTYGIEGARITYRENGVLRLKDANELDVSIQAVCKTDEQRRGWAALNISKWLVYNPPPKAEVVDYDLNSQGELEYIAGLFAECIAVDELDPFEDVSWNYLLSYFQRRLRTYRSLDTSNMVKARRRSIAGLVIHYEKAVAFVEVLIASREGDEG